MLSKVASRTRLPLFHHFGEEKGVKRELFGESGESFGERSPLFTPFGESLRKFGESFAENFCENSPRGWWAFEENSLKFAKKKQDATPAPPRLGPTNSPPARHRFTGHHTVWS